MSRIYPKVAIRSTSPTRNTARFLVSPSPTHSPTYSPTHTPTVSPTVSPTHTPTVSPTHIPTHVPTSSRKRRLNAEDIEGLDDFFNKKIKDASFNQSEEIVKLREVIAKQAKEIEELQAKVRMLEGKLDTIRSSIEDALFMM